jgi:hypothetical protein
VANVSGQSGYTGEREESHYDAGFLLGRRVREMSPAEAWLDRGLDLSNLDATGSAEIEQFRESYRKSHGKSLAAYEFWLQFDPAVAKLHRTQILGSSSRHTVGYPLIGTLGFLYLYAVTFYEEGVRYETHHAYDQGASVAEILQTLELAMISAGPRSADVAWSAARPVLAELPERPGPVRDRFPGHWQGKAGNLFDIDLPSSRHADRAAASTAIANWYEQVTGSVPAWIGYLAEHRPELLVALVARRARAMRGPLPVQMLPLLLIHAGTAVGHERQLTEGLSFVQAAGITADEVAEAVSWGVLVSGISGADLAARIVARAHH